MIFLFLAAWICLLTVLDRIVPVAWLDRIADRLEGRR